MELTTILIALAIVQATMGMENFMRTRCEMTFDGQLPDKMFRDIFSLDKCQEDLGDKGKLIITVPPITQHSTDTETPEEMSKQPNVCMPKMTTVTVTGPNANSTYVDGSCGTIFNATKLPNLYDCHCIKYSDGNATTVLEFNITADQKSFEITVDVGTYDFDDGVYDNEKNMVSDEYTWERITVELAKKDGSIAVTDPLATPVPKATTTTTTTTTTTSTTTTTTPELTTTTPESGDVQTAMQCGSTKITTRILKADTVSLVKKYTDFFGTAKKIHAMIWPFLVSIELTCKSGTKGSCDAVYIGKYTFVLSKICAIVCGATGNFDGQSAGPMKITEIKIKRSVLTNMEDVPLLADDFTDKTLDGNPNIVLIKITKNDALNDTLSPACYDKFMSEAEKGKAELTDLYQRTNVVTTSGGALRYVAFATVTYGTSKKKNTVSKFTVSKYKYTCKSIEVGSPFWRITIHETRIIWSLVGFVKIDEACTTGTSAFKGELKVVELTETDKVEIDTYMNDH